MKIISIMISNIWSFEYADKIDDAFTLNFETGLNIVIGPNGAGKSNFVEIINQLFKRVIPLSITFSEENIENVKRDPRNYKYYQTLGSNHLKADFKKNRNSQSEVKKIRLILEMNDTDRENLLFITNNIDTLKHLSEKYVYPDVRPSFDEVVSIDEIKNYSKLILDITFSNFENDYKILTSGDNKANDFVLNYFKYFQIIQALIYISNKYETKEKWKPLKNSFALIGSDRSYSSIDQIYPISKTRESKRNEILRSIELEGTKTPNAKEPSIFLLVKHQLAYFYHNVRHNYSDSLINNPKAETPIQVLEKDVFFKSINEKLCDTLGLRITLKNIRDSADYEFIFYDTKHNPIDISELSAGEKGIVHFIFSLYGHDIHAGLFLVDEPELHIHPQMQKKYLNIIKKIQQEFSLQFILITHSSIFLDSSTIRHTYRFYKDGSSYTQFSKPMITQSDNDLMQIINYSNTSKIFFTKKVLLVEGVLDEFFFNFLIDRIKEKENYRNIDLEVINIVGKGNFLKWREFLDKFHIPNYFIGDLDNIFTLPFKTFDIKLRLDLEEELEKDPKIKKSITEDTNYKNTKTYRRNLLDFVKSKANTWQKIESEIQEKYNEGIFILKEGELEIYTCKAKKIEKLVEFCKNEFPAWNSDHNPKRNELFNILMLILNSDINIYLYRNNIQTNYYLMAIKTKLFHSVNPQVALQGSSPSHDISDQ